MSTVASRELRNHTADVLRQVANGETVLVTVRGEVVAEISPPAGQRKASFSRAEFIRRVIPRQADAGLADDLRALGDESTDDLGPIR